MRYVIVGNGVACLGAIEGIRRQDKTGEILVISEERMPTYGRPLISYYLAGKIGADKLALRPAEYYDRMKVEMVLGHEVTAIDPAAKTVALDDGRIVGYDKLLLATGGKPFIPPIENVKGPGIFNFTTVAHADELLAASGKIRRVVVVGGGLIGLKAAEGLHDRGLSVTIVELSPRVLSAAFDDQAGGLVSRRLAEEGLQVKTGVSAKSIDRRPDGSVLGVTLTNGEKIPADAVVVAVGVTPNSALAKQAGVQVERGILVDDRMQTSTPDVYAAGDVAQAYDQLAKERRVTPIWINAFAQGFCAGKNMAGKDEAYQGGLAMNAIDFYGLRTVSVGMVNPGPNEPGLEIATRLDYDNAIYRKLVFREGKLVGYVLVGDIANAGIYTGFIRFGLEVTDDLREQMLAGRPTQLNWPSEFFDEKFNPAPTGGSY